MKLLYSATSYPPSIGGGQLYTHCLAQYMSRTHDVQVVAHWDENRTDWLLGTTLRAPHHCKDYEIDGVPVHRMGIPGTMRWRFLPWVVSFYAMQGLAIDALSESLFRQIAQHIKPADLVHNVRMGREGLSYASLKLARKWGVPFVLTPLHHPRWGGWMHRHFTQLYQMADGLLALTLHEKKVLVSLGANADKVFVTGMGPILADHSQPQRFRKLYSIDGPMVLFLGQKFRYKNFDALLDAAELTWQRLSDVTFVFVGPRTRYSARRFGQVHDPRIIELGRVTLEEKTDALAACDILCTPSSQESFGGVFVEAWMFEKPVIGGDAPAVADVITDGYDGFLVSSEPAQIADRIVTLLRDTQLSVAMGTRGKQKVLNHYTWDELGSKTETIYKKLMKV